MAYTYDADGLITRAGTLGIVRDAQTGWVTGTSIGSVRTSAVFDSVGRMRSKSARGSVDELYATSYTRDLSGRLTHLTETLVGETSAYEFRRDSSGRLTEVLRSGAVVESYEYDPNGNRTRALGVGGVAAGTYDEQDRMLAYGGATYGYSANGVLAFRAVGADTTRYEYDAYGALRSVTRPGGLRTEYVIDAVGRRVGRKVNGRMVQRFVYASSLQVVAELDSVGAVASRYVYAGGSNVPEYMERGGRTYRLLKDHLGSVRLVVDTESGAVAQRLDYDAWGMVTRDSNPGFQPFGYAGGLYDPETGLVRFGARDYDAQTGRWTAKDPIAFLGGDTNLYAYVQNDPVTLSDASGLCPRQRRDCNKLRETLRTFIDRIVWRLDKWHEAMDNPTGDHTTNGHLEQVQNDRRGLRKTKNLYSRDCSDDDDYDGNLQEALETLELPIRQGPGRYDVKGSLPPINIPPPTPEQAEAMAQSTLILLIIAGTVSLLTG